MNVMKALTLQIGIFGKTNSGKSSLMNLIAGQRISTVSDIAGTTTDVVYKQMELNPLGPVTFIDTPGLGDISVLGNKREENARKVFDSCDIILLVCDDTNLNYSEENIIDYAREKNTPLIAVINTNTSKKSDKNLIDKISSYTENIIEVSATDLSKRDYFLEELKKILIKILPENYFDDYSALKNIISAGESAVLVVPIDSGAPRGRLIMPQVQTIRNILDLNAFACIVKDDGYEKFISKMQNTASLVITDSQIVKEIALKTPENVKLTTFSVLFAADKSDINELAKGAAMIEKLKDGDKVLIAEACTHHALNDDIGRIKIPNWLKKYTGKNIICEVASGRDYPDNLSEYKLVIHCGACTLNRKAMLSRMAKASRYGIAVTNYGIAISVFQGVIEKVLEVFPDAFEAYRKELISF